MKQIESQARRSGPALEKMYQFLLWLVPTVEKFPRAQKFLLGDRIQSTALDVMERLIEAPYSRDKGVMLTQANLSLEKLRFCLASTLPLAGAAASMDAAGVLGSIHGPS